MTGPDGFRYTAAGHPIHRISRRAVFVQPQARVAARVLTHLPELGAVLCHVSHGPCAERGRMHDSRCPFAGHAWLVQMEATAHICARVALDSDGPREWLECVQADGRVWMRIWLLPDSDFCAWDRLLDHVESVPEPESRHCALRAALRNACAGRQGGEAGLVRFTLRHVAGMPRLGLVEDEAASALSRQRASMLMRQLRLGAWRLP